MSFARPAAPTVAQIAVRLVAGVAAALALIVAALVIPARPALAADVGPGWQAEENGGLGFLGAFVAGGRNVYCLEPSRDAPVDESTPLGYGGWGSAAPDDLARASWAIATTGQSADRRDTAAVAMYVWSLLAPVEYAAHGMPGDEWYARYVPDAEDRAGVLARLARLRLEGAAIRAVPGSGAGAIELSIDPVDEYLGTVAVSGLSPAGAVGTLVIEHAAFDATGSATIAGVGNGAVLPITAIPPDGATPYRVAVDGSFAVSGWSAELSLWATPGAQTLADAGRRVDLVFPLRGADPRERSVLFQPVVTTVAQERVEPGARFRDTLRFALAPDERGRVNRWFRDPSGAHLPITASCRVYGPFARRPATMPSPPPGAPLASSFVVTTGRDGPGVDYPVDSEQRLDAVGWYTTQCSIDAGSQPASSRPFLPPGYRFEDAFGVGSETAAVPFLASLGTAFTERTGAPGEAMVDVVTVGIAEGPWLAGEDGEPRPIELEGRFTAVRERPTRAAAAPEEAELVAVRRLTAPGPGEYRAAPVEMPDDGRWLVAQWCVLESTVVRAGCDDWGVPAETVAPVAPPSPPPSAPPAPALAATGDGGLGLAAGAGLAAVVVGSVALLRLAGLSRRGRPPRRPAPPARGPRRRPGSA